MTKRPWVPHYLPGTRADIDPIPYRHLAEWMAVASQKYASQTAFGQVLPNGMNASLTYRQIDAHSDAFAAYLREVAGIRTGDRVAIQLPNCLAYPIVLIGILKAGAVIVNTNPLYTPTEMLHQFSDSGARVLVMIDMFADRLPKILPQTKIEKVVLVKITEFFKPMQAAVVGFVMKYVKDQIPRAEFPYTEFASTLAQGRAALAATGAGGGRSVTERYCADLTPDSLAALQYTGGTTGVAKAAMLTHLNLMANAAQVFEFIGPEKLTPGIEVIITPLPLYHIFAFTVNLLVFYLNGGENILIPSPRPPSNLKAAMLKYPITWFTGVNTLFNALTNEPWFRAQPPKSLKASVAGGMALHKAVAERWEKAAGSPVIEGYGLTEASPVLSFNPMGGLTKAETIGIPLPSTDIMLLDDQDHEVAMGEPGELCARGPQIMKGYWERPDETAKVFLKLGGETWLRTGDIATVDADGYFKIVDRKKDMILTSGFNVFPNEIEDRLAAHPAVLESAAIGVPDESSGEIVKAFVVLRPGQTATEDELRAFCREALTGYKVPKHIEFRKDMPKSPVGKILRKDLRKN